MNVSVLKFNSRSQLKWIFVLLFWFLSFVFLFALSASNELNTTGNYAVSSTPTLAPVKDEIRGLKFLKRDSRYDGRIIYSICFDRLASENNKLGIFKTALHKVVKIRNLQLEFYRYSSNQPFLSKRHYPGQSVQPSKDAPDDLSNFILDDILFGQGRTGDSWEAVVRSFDKLKNSLYGWTVDIDFSNVSEIKINEFSYRVFCDSDLQFGLQSKRLLASYREPDIIIRGHVVLTAADGGTLEANYVKWDTGKQHFVVDGIYVIRRNGTKDMGKGICVDTQLRPVKGQWGKEKRKEADRCFAKM